MKTILKFGFFNSVIGLFVGIIVWVISTGNGYELFPFAAAISGFFTAILFWSLLNKKSKPIKTRNAIFAGILTGIFSHYFCWLIVNIFMNICYWTTDGCVDSFGAPPASLYEMLSGGIVLSFFSLLFFGWLTITLSIIAGLILKKSVNKQFR